MTGHGQNGVFGCSNTKLSAAATPDETHEQHLIFNKDYGKYTRLESPLVTDSVGAAVVGPSVSSRPKVPYGLPEGLSVSGLAPPALNSS